jgi:hypothetical protein
MNGEGTIEATRSGGPCPSAEGFRVAAEEDRIAFRRTHAAR